MKIVSIVLAAASCWIHSATAYTCEHDSYPFGLYTTFFAPCQVLFYQSSSSSNNDTVEAAADWGYGCDSMDTFTVPLETRPILITDFPDQCVGDEARCYTLENKMMSLNKSLHESLLPPEGTTHVMVNCMEDNTAANAAADQFVGNLTEAADEFTNAAENFAHAMVIFGWVVMLTLVASIGACIYCCIAGCGGNSGRRRVTHATAIPYQEVEMQMGQFT
jgi:hypothetical protein